MMRQYQEAKRVCPGALLLFRMGDFYELFYDDAKEAARLLGLALTSREKGENAIPMAGFPHHQLDSYLAKMIAAGLRAAVCEQVEDPKLAKGLVRREVTRVVTPGTVTDEALLDPRRSNYLAAVVPGEPAGLAWVDISTGQFVAGSCPAAALADQLARVAPAECLLAEDQPCCAEGDSPMFADHAARGARPGGVPAKIGTVPGIERMMVTRRPPWAFALETARQNLLAQFHTTGLEGFGFTDSQADAQALRAAGAVVDYLKETQRASLAHVDRLVPQRAASTLEIDQSSRRSLEITQTIREGRREGSLLAVLDRTVTAMGARLLADWLANPLVDLAAIRARHEALAELLAEPALADALRETLRRIYDLQRLLARATTGRASPRDLSFLGRTLRALPALKAKLAARRSPLLNQLETELDLCPELRSRLDAALAEDCPLASREGGFIRDGFHAELDALRELGHGGKQWIAAYQAREVERTGIPTLKVGFNKVFGYYLEITNVHRQKIPADYIRKQTVKNAERYITPELKEYEEKVLTADQQAKDLEFGLFLELRDAVAACRSRVQASAAVLAEIDVLAALAELARQRNYCRPEMVEEPVLEIADGRHPVLDACEPQGTFVPNDLAAGGPHGTMLLITGPNMSGKSTYIRQAALIALMAQIGSFVPARRASIGLTDRIFARVGASDELARGQSTFMVEMTETARILNTATPRSLVILDEIGRGTSTYDGISLAWAVVEYLQEHVGCRTLFATHYHELTDLEKSLSGVKNLNVAVREWQEEVVFLHKIVEGAADKSYGIHVARLAGVPRQVIERGKEILAQLEEEHLDAEGRAKIARPRPAEKTSHFQLTLFGPAEPPLVDELRRMDLDSLTPRAALELLARWQGELGTGRK
jgi:DNA mismatch repair protein MutS